MICKSESSVYKGKRFPTGKDDSFIMRKELNCHLAQNGIDRSVVRSCDRVVQNEEDLPLNDKLQAYPQKNSFAKKDINQFIDDVVTKYCTRDNLLSLPIFIVCFMPSNQYLRSGYCFASAKYDFPIFRFSKP